jgi:hypothetical protein
MKLVSILLPIMVCLHSHGKLMASLCLKGELNWVLLCLSYNNHSFERPCDPLK